MSTQAQTYFTGGRSDEEIPGSIHGTGNDPFYENEVQGKSSSVTEKEGGYNGQTPILVRRRN